MKDIVELAFSGECKNPKVTNDDGKHFFCAEPAPEGDVYCPTCAQRMRIPTRHYTDSADLADRLGGGKSRPPSNEHASGGMQPTDGFMRGAGAATYSNHDAVRSEAFTKKIRVVA